MPVTRHAAKKKNNKYKYSVQSEEYVLISDFEELKQRVQSLETKVDWTEEETEELTFPEQILENLPSEVRKTIEGIMFNYQNNYPNFSGMGMRKALIDAIRIRLKQDGKEDKLYDKDGNAYKLPKWIELAKQEKYIDSRCAKYLRGQVKVFGEKATHDYMADLQKEEIPFIFIQLRMALARMYYKEK